MSDNPLSHLPDVVRQAIARTPARILAGRSGIGYRTATTMRLREDHAIARDAVHAELDPVFAESVGLPMVKSRASSKAEYLMRPDLGRQLSDAGRDIVWSNCPPAADLQVVIGDGLSATAVTTQVPSLLPLIEAVAVARGWRFGRPFVVRYCRVGIMNDVGAILEPAVIVLLIGERPGLATAESLSAYLGYRPRLGHTDAQRNLISNIHARGVTIPDAAQRIAALAARMMHLRSSGVEVKEEAAVTSPALQLDRE